MCLCLCEAWTHAVQHDDAVPHSLCVEVREDIKYQAFLEEESNLLSDD